MLLFAGDEIITVGLLLTVILIGLEVAISPLLFVAFAVRLLVPSVGLFHK